MKVCLKLYIPSSVPNLKWSFTTVLNRYEKKSLRLFSVAAKSPSILEGMNKNASLFILINTVNL